MASVSYNTYAEADGSTLGVLEMIKVTVADTDSLPHAVSGSGCSSNGGLCGERIRHKIRRASSGRRRSASNLNGGTDDELACGTTTCRQNSPAHRSTSTSRTSEAEVATPRNLRRWLKLEG